jgi:type II restriction/modification system DNA methylase subunit YeeA
LVRRDEDRWIIDFGTNAREGDAALYEFPFEYVVKRVKPTRLNLRRQWHRTRWWLHGDPRPAFRRAVTGINRFIATPRISKHRIFVWMHPSVLPDSAVVAIVRDDDTSFGVLHSRFHEAWALRLGTSLEDRPRYTPSTTFETFPFPEGLTPNRPAAEYADDLRAILITDAARRLNELREAWLNPPELVERVREVVPGYPDCIVPVSPKAAVILKKRTLTNLYNERPAWLDNAHRELDAAVATAYGWSADISEDEALARLLALNHERAAAGR